MAVRLAVLRAVRRLAVLLLFHQFVVLRLVLFLVHERFAVVRLEVVRLDVARLVLVRLAVVRLLDFLVRFFQVFFAFFQLERRLLAALCLRALLVRVVRRRVVVAIFESS